jgi:hypothetical protein
MTLFWILETCTAVLTVCVFVLACCARHYRDIAKRLLAAVNESTRQLEASTQTMERADAERESLREALAEARQRQGRGYQP